MTTEKPTKHEDFVTAKDIIKNVYDLQGRIDSEEDSVSHRAIEIPKGQSYYVASPYTSYESAHPTSNSLRLKEAWLSSCEFGSALVRNGYDVFVPIAHGHALHEQAALPETHDFWMEVDKKHIDRMDALIVLCIPGWEKSRGIREEVEHAAGRGMEIYFVHVPVEWFLPDGAAEYSPFAYLTNTDHDGYHCYAFALAKDTKSTAPLTIGELLDAWDEDLSQDERERAFEDAALFGTGVMKDGERLPPSAYLKDGKQGVLHDAMVAVRARGASYGDVGENFERIAARWNVHLHQRYGISARIDVDDVAVMMIDMKLARMVETPLHWDSLVDIAGYAACLGELAKEKEDGDA